MEKSLEELSASALRNLLIEEVKKFISCLEHGSTAELHEMKLHLRKIFDLIADKEQEENLPLIWGKNSTTATNVSLTITETEPKDEIISDHA